MRRGGWASARKAHVSYRPLPTLAHEQSLSQPEKPVTPFILLHAKWYAVNLVKSRAPELMPMV